MRSGWRGVGRQSWRRRTITVDPAPFSLANGESHAVTGTVTANQPAADGRSLFGAMNVVSEDDALLGTGDVTVKHVTG